MRSPRLIDSSLALKPAMGAESWIPTEYLALGAELPFCDWDEVLNLAVLPPLPFTLVDRVAGLLVSPPTYLSALAVTIT